MQNEQMAFFQTIKYGSIAFTGLTLSGIATLMYVARDKDEDIAGIVAPALMIAIISTFVAILSAALQKYASQRSTK
ncbi:MAG: hypothetical protein QM785_06940 [Pyrinomonadaceae bacterium]